MTETLTSEWEQDSNELRNLILGYYLMDAVENFIDNNPGVITIEASKELNPDITPAFTEATDRNDTVNYLRDWTTRHSIPLDIEGLARIGKQNYVELKQRYKKESAQEN